jgi:hypothetical protein
MLPKPKRLVYAYNPKIHEIALKKLTSEPNWENIVFIFLIKEKVSEIDEILRIQNEKKKSKVKLNEIKTNVISKM